MIDEKKKEKPEQFPATIQISDIGRLIYTIFYVSTYEG